MTTLLDAATVVAATAHCGQRRKYTNEPYIVHPLEVIQILMQHGITDEVILSAAVLHDVIEDTPHGSTWLRAKFLQHGFSLEQATSVVSLVEELTEPAHVGNRAARKAAEAQRLSQISPDAQTIKYADLISNTNSIVERDKGFAKVYLAEKDAILKVMRDGNPELLKAALISLEIGRWALEDVE